MKIKSLLLTAGLAFGGLTAPTASASTVDVIGGVTEVEILSFFTLTNAGFNVGLLGSATLDASGLIPVASFGITGGSVDTVTGNALIEHDGSGVSLDNGVDFVNLENFLVNTETLILSGDVTVNGSFVANVDLFNITGGTLLQLTGGAADALNGVFGTSIPEGFKFGHATVSPVVVPVPAAFPLMVTALAGLGFASRRRAA
ncbi:MAG: PEP-CTERM sorting domain-containing protein [Pseudomonadota bacterium]